MSANQLIVIKEEYHDELYRRKNIIKELKQLRENLHKLTIYKVRKYAHALDLPVSINGNRIRKDYIIDSLIKKVKNSQRLYPDWMKRVDIGETKPIYMPSDLIDRLYKDELIRIAYQYGCTSLQNKTKDELIYFIKSEIGKEIQTSVDHDISMANSDF